ncbi:MAG: hypothetical protein NTW10_03870 [Bacteroidetes bacterium]|nr:hypothetical protein [Bacteroidota bacterium]
MIKNWTKTEFEQEAYKMLYNNSIVFLKDGIERLVNKDRGDEDLIDHDLLALTCTSFQISLELAIKALIIERDGIRCILNSKQQKLGDEEIESLLKENKLNTLDFEAQKNFIKSKNYIQDLSRDEFNVIEEFQLYRNRIVHFSFKFCEGDLFDLKYDIIYYLIHVIFKVLLSRKHQDEKPSEFLEYSLGSPLHKRLMHYPPYVYAMEKLARDNSDQVFKCIVCNNRTFSQDEDYCYCCNFSTELYSMIDCDYCGAKRSVIYDNLDIELNNNEMKGLCLNCDNDGIVFQCPKCGEAHNIETRFESVCTHNKCINE